MKLRRPQERPPQRPKAFEVLGMPEPEPEKIWFDPEREISPAEWEEARKLLQKLRKIKRHGHEDRYLDLAKSLKTLAPKRFPEIDSDIEMQEKFLQKIFSLRQQKDKHREYCSLASKYLQVFPQRRQDFGLIEQDWELIQKRLWDQMRRLYGRPIVEIKNATWLFPDRQDQWISREQTWVKAKEIFEEYRRKSIFDSYSSTILKIAFPEHAEEIVLDEPFWRQMRDRMNLLRKEKIWENLFSLAANLYLLSADQVKMTDQGLQVIKRTTPLPAQRPLPERPQF